MSIGMNAGQCSCRSRVFLLSALLAGVLTLGGCSDGAPDAGHPDLPITHTFGIEQMQGGGVAVEGSVEGTSAGDGTSLTFARNIKAMTMILRKVDGTALDTLPMSPIADAGMWSGKGGSDTLRLKDEVVWPNPEGLKLKNIIAVLEVEHVDGSMYAATQNFVLGEAKKQVFKGLSLRPIIEDQSESSATFTMLAQRRRAIKNEHFTTEETFRVEILDGSEVLWSSAHGRQFNPLYAVVEPVNDGSFHRNSIEWDGMTNAGEPLAAGEYTVRMTIPCLPAAYSDSLTLKWKLSQ